MDDNEHRETQQSERGDQGLPGQGGHNREDVAPQQPTRRKDATDDDDRSVEERKGGESGEGSQSTGNPDSAG